MKILRILFWPAQVLPALGDAFADDVGPDYQGIRAILGIFGVVFILFVGFFTFHVLYDRVQLEYEHFLLAGVCYVLGMCMAGACSEYED